MKKVKSKRRGYVNQMQTFLSICLPEEMKNGQYFSIVMLEEVQEQSSSEWKGREFQAQTSHFTGDRIESFLVDVKTEENVQKSERLERIVNINIKKNGEFY